MKILRLINPPTSLASHPLTPVFRISVFFLCLPFHIFLLSAGYMNVGCGGKAGYYFSSTCVLVGSFTLFFIDLHRRNLSRHKHTRANGTRHLCVSDSCPQRRRLSFSQEPENEGVAAGAAAAALVLGAELAPTPGN